MANFVINRTASDWKVEKSEVFTSCSTIFTYTVTAAQGDSIDVSLAGSYENGVYINNGVKNDILNVSTNITYNNSLVLSISIPNSGVSGKFLDSVISITNNNSSNADKTYTNTAVRESDDQNCDDKDGDKIQINGNIEPNQVTVWSDETTITGHNGFVFDGSNLGVGTNLPLHKIHIVGGGLIEGDLIVSSNANFNRAYSAQQAVDSDELVRLDQIQSMLDGLRWQEAVIDQVDFTSSEPLSPTDGDRYINISTGSGSTTSGTTFTKDYIYEYLDGVWAENVPQEGWTLWDEADDKNYTYNGTNWISMAATVSHNSTIGLQGGDASGTGEFYHLTGSEYSAVAYTDVQNVFTQNQQIGADKTLTEGDNNKNLNIWGRIDQRGLGSSVFIGRYTGQSDDLTENHNTAVGDGSFSLNTEGFNNTALGADTLRTNTVGSFNLALGYRALYSADASSNTAVGSAAMFRTNTGTNNMALGRNSMFENTDGSYNTSIGNNALYWCSAGNDNVAIGYIAGQKDSFGANLESASRSVLIGSRAKPLTAGETNQIVIGYDANGHGSNTVTIGNDDITNTYLKGDLNLDGYGVGSKSSSQSYFLGVDSLGNVVETLGPGGTGYEVISNLSDLDSLIALGSSGNWMVTGNIVLDSSKVVPPYVSMTFNGGVIDCNSFTLEGDNTLIRVGREKIFAPGSILGGTWQNKDVYIEWWGVGVDGLIDAKSSIEAASMLKGELHFPKLIAIDSVTTISSDVWLSGHTEGTSIVTTISGEIFRSTSDWLKITKFNHTSSTTNNTFLEPLSDLSYLELSDNTFSPIDDNVSNFFVTIASQTGGAPAIVATEIIINNNRITNSKVLYADTIVSDRVELSGNKVDKPTQFTFRVNALLNDTSGSQVDKLFAKENIITNINGGLSDKSNTARCFQVEALYSELEGNILDGAESTTASNFAYIKDGSYKIFNNTIKAIKGQSTTAIIDNKGGGSYTTYIDAYGNVFDQTDVDHADTPETCVRVYAASNVSFHDNKFHNLKSYAFRVYHSADIGQYPNNCSFYDNEIYNIDFPVVAQVFQNSTNTTIKNNVVRSISNTQGISVNSFTENRMVDIYQSFNNGSKIENVTVSNNTIVSSVGDIYVATIYINTAAVTSGIDGVKVIGNNVYSSTTNTGAFVGFNGSVNSAENVDILNNSGFAAMTETDGPATASIRKQNNVPLSAADSVYLPTAGGSMDANADIIIPPGTGGLTGTYDIAEKRTVYSMGANYKLGATNDGFGNLYGFSMEYDAAERGQGHMITFSANGVPKASLGNYVWARSGFKKENGTSAQFLKADGTVDSNEYISSDNTPSNGETLKYSSLSGWVSSKTSFALNSTSLTGVESESCTASGALSFSVGDSSLSSGESSISMGFECQSTGYASISMGSEAYSTGDQAVSIGSYSDASGYDSISIGGNASGDNSVSIGQNSFAQGEFSYANGYLSYANGKFSKSIGFGAISSGYASTAVGSFPTEEVGANATAYSVDNRAYVIGIGYDNTNRKDGLEIGFDGVVKAPSATVADVDSASDEVLVTKGWINSNLPKNLTITVDASALSSISSSPVELIPAQGALTYIDVVSISGVFNFNTASYDFGVLGAKIGSESGTSSVQVVSDIMNSSITTPFKLSSLQTGLMGFNEKLELSAGANPTVGDGTITLNISYYVRG